MVKRIGLILLSIVMIGASSISAFAAVNLDGERYPPSGAEGAYKYLPGEYAWLVEKLSPKVSNGA